MRRILLIIIILFSPTFQEAIACLNGESKELKNGLLLFLDAEGDVPSGHSFNSDEELQRGLVQMDSLFKITKDYDYLSDKGLLLIVLKRYDDAIQLYLDLEKIAPDRYSTASNLGTAYELIGQNENALKWIKRSVEIDPRSHYDSEWIHVKILEAKIKGEQFYTTKFLLNTDFGLDDEPHTQMSAKELTALHRALYYQLNERLSFVKPKEKIVAQLLFDLGNLALVLGNNEIALMDYKEAKLYGFTDPLIERRIAKASEVPEPARVVKKSTMSLVILWTTLGGLLGLVIFAIYQGRSA